jgi:hypothetical protein
MSIMTMHELVNSVRGWHHDRNLILGASDADQYHKLIQEASELSDNLCKGKCIKDDLGDMLVVLINIAERNMLRMLVVSPLLYRNSAFPPMFNRIESVGKEHFIKLIQRCSELSMNFGDGNEGIKPNVNGISASISGIIKVLGTIADENYLNLRECLQVAYDDIKDRKGRMYDGVFIKEIDL